LLAASSGGTNTIKQNAKAANKAAREERLSISQPAPGVVGPFAVMDVPWLLRMRSQTRRDHPFLIWAPFEAPARISETTTATDREYLFRHCERSEAIHRATKQDPDCFVACAPCDDSGETKPNKGAAIC